MRKLGLFLIIIYAACLMYITWLIFPLPVVKASRGCCSAKACARDMHHQ